MKLFNPTTEAPLIPMTEKELFGIRGGDSNGEEPAKRSSECVAPIYNGCSVKINNCDKCDKCGICVKVMDCKVDKCDKCDAGCV